MEKICKTCGKIANLSPWEEDCYSCRCAKHVKKIQQEIIDGTLRNGTCCEDEIYCPWCGAINDDPAMQEAYEEGEHVIECCECEKEFTLDTSISYSYSTYRELPEWVVEDRERAAELNQKRR